MRIGNKNSLIVCDGDNLSSDGGGRANGGLVHAEEETSNSSSFVF